MSRILVAPGSFKGSLTSVEATDEIVDVLHRELPEHEVSHLYLADGGEGTLQVLYKNFGGQLLTETVEDAFGAHVRATLYLQGRSAVIESAQVIGGNRPGYTLNPWRASTYGIGELILAAIDLGAQSVTVTMGDSLTMDMGVGMLAALGVRFYSGKQLLNRPTLSDLHAITSFDFSSADRLLRTTSFRALVDTFDYVCGPHGQAHMYGPQKGLTLQDTVRAEAALRNFCRVIVDRFGIDVAELPLGGGSGGLAASLHSFLSAPLSHTVTCLDSALDITETIRNAEYVVTGEGCLDRQSRWGKVPYYVASRTTGRCVILVGDYSEEGLRDLERVCDRPEIILTNGVPTSSAPSGASASYSIRRASKSIASVIRSSTFEKRLG